MLTQIAIVTVSTLAYLAVIRVYVAVARQVRRSGGPTLRMIATLLSYVGLLAFAFGFGFLFEAIGFSGGSLVAVWMVFFISAMVLGKVLFLKGERFSTLFDQLDV